MCHYTLVGSLTKLWPIYWVLLPSYLAVNSPFPQIDIIIAMNIVWRVNGKTIRSVLCSIVYNSCAQCSAHTHMSRPLTVVCWLDLAFLWLYCVSKFICVRFSFLPYLLVWFICVCVLLLCQVCFLRYSQEIGWEERLQNDLFCVEWDVKP